MEQDIVVGEAPGDDGKKDLLEKVGDLPAEQGVRKHEQPEGYVEKNDDGIVFSAAEKKVVAQKGNAAVNLSESKLTPEPPNQKLELRHKKMFYSDSNLMNDALVGKQIESFKIKLKERQSEKSWAHLTTANLQSLTKSQEPTSKQHAFQRIRKWVQDSSPPYDANPSPGVSSLTSAPPEHKSCGIFGLFWCFR